MALHGLPLMGGGDWNDGMNRVGKAGKGESVWLGWFTIFCLNRFAVLAEARGDAAIAARLRSRAAARRAIEADAWDGAWYRRDPILTTARRWARLRAEPVRSIRWRSRGP